MIGETAKCHNKGCEIEFIKKTHNQVYHDDECCRIATNMKIMEKYYKKRAVKLGLPRYCDICSTKLSRYNSDSKCNSCSMKSESEKNNNLKNTLSQICFQN